MRSKRLNYFLSAKDEASLSADLIAAFPEIAFVDDCRWKTVDPPCKPSIDTCDSSYVYLWNKAIFPTLPAKEVSDNSVMGPQAYYVIQFQRNRCRDGFMQSAQLSMSIDDANSEHKAFCEKIYRLVKERHARSMRCIDLRSGETVRSGINNLILGSDAAEQAERTGLKFVLGFGSHEIFEPENR